MANAKGMGKRTTTKPVKTDMNGQVDDRKYLCPYCNKEKKREYFYVSSDPLVMTGLTTMCRECAEKIARNWNESLKEFGDCTKASIQAALERLDKPWLEDIYNSSYFEVNNPKSEKRKSNFWAAYIKNISMPQYKAMRWRDGDVYETYKARAAAAVAPVEIQTESDDHKGQEIIEAYKTNRRDVLRLIGYDPFANYPVESDKPVLYAQLISFIDEETKNDGMKMNAVIQIVQAFNQIQKINDAINDLSSDVMKINNNNGAIKQHADTISKLLSGANALAKDNGISVNFNNSKSKGQNTLTGKMKELDLIGFRDAKINMYDIDYCAGMQQVANISCKAQVDQIGYDENVMNEISNIRRELVDSLQKERDKAVERARLLLVENKDLKEFLKDKGLIDEFGKVIEHE